ncbi:hypothetical protein [Rhizobium oryziradicis]|uniref:Lipoprotein n=1 Tax=Rhizobium oryziradicis TaxID=1867956 RepID=A0A1Q8ZRK6_9HYPH|nr:hypothetical protein [Rhizobium oryziradicis]OLP44714.1 hypothetical protein BJF95_09510 [Rhizobium oryziradicis]
MTSGNNLIRTRTLPAHTLKAATALIALSMLGSCATTKTPAPIADQGSIGDADVPQVVYRNKGPYKDPLVTTQHAGPEARSTTPTHSGNLEEAQAEPAAPRPSASSTRGGLFTAQAEPAVQTEGNNSIVPSRMPSRSIQATVASVYSLQTPLEQDAQVQPTEPAPRQMPAEQQPRRPSKAEILAGLAPDPSKRQNMQQMRQSTAQAQTMPAQSTPAQNTQAMATQLSPAETAQLQASIPTATPAAANSTAASQMEQIQGAPQAQGMTRDSFIKKFLAKLRK